MTKLHISLADGTLEVDGSEEFVKEIYQDFKEQLKESSQSHSLGSGRALMTAVNSLSSETGTSSHAISPKGSSKRPKSNFTIVKDLDLSAKSNALSLREFFTAKSPANAMECNAVFVYYLQQIAQIRPITVDHVYSCYKDVNIKYPNALKQSLADTSSRRGWLDTHSLDDIQIATPGENYVEHSLPRLAGKR